MKKRQTLSKLVATATVAFASMTGFAQTDLGSECGCPPVGSRPTINLSTVADTAGNLTASNTILSCQNTYILDDKIYVGNGKTITINAGTLIRGQVGAAAGDANALIVSRGGKIFATGTESCPIVFTSSTDPMDGSHPVQNVGEWGGVVVLGIATNNLTPANDLSAGGVDGVGFIEGFTPTPDPRAWYGAGDAAFPGSFDDNDNSGVMTYVSIRHAGETVGTDNELNGLTLGSVGRGTVLRNIEVVSNDDDGIEFFGGTVDIKYATTLFCKDDNFDTDQGYSGRGQFLFTLQGAGTGDNGFEWDTDDQDTSVNGGAILTAPQFYNATIIGNGGSGDKGLEMKEGIAGGVYSSIFANFDIFININNEVKPSRPYTAYSNWNGGDLQIECNSFVGTTGTSYLTIQGAASSAGDDAKLLADDNQNIASIPGTDFIFAIDGATNVVSDNYDAIPTNDVASACTPPADGFFTPTSYRGAFAAGETNWLSNWAYQTVLGTTAGLLPCPTDINKDGATTNADFLQLLGQFNQTCN